MSYQTIPVSFIPEAWPGKQFFDAVYYSMPDFMKLAYGPFGPEVLDQKGRKAAYTYTCSRGGPEQRPPIVLSRATAETCRLLHLPPYLFKA